MIAFSGCYKSEFYVADNPEEGQVVVLLPTPDDDDDDDTTDYSMTLIFEGEEYDVNPGESFTIPELFEPGDYTCYVYTNPTDDDSTYFSYDSTTGSIIASAPTDNDGNVETISDALYFGTENITVLSDTSVLATTELNKLGRELHFKLELSGDAVLRLVNFSATLNGVAQQWDCINDTAYGTSTSILPILSMSSAAASVSATKSSSGYYLEGMVHLLGLHTDEAQNLILELDYTDNNPTPHLFTSDVSDLLSGFNDDNYTAMILSNSIETPSEVNPDGTIGEWVVTEYSITVK